ncbi:MAG: hypothetical protein AABX37_01715 [Nanoarchaeota archaeon]
MTKIVLGYNNFAVHPTYVRDAADHLLNPGALLPKSVREVLYSTTLFQAARERVIARYSPAITCQLSLQGRRSDVMCVLLEGPQEGEGYLEQAMQLYIMTSRVPDRILPPSEYSLAEKVLGGFDRKLDWELFGKYFGWNVIPIHPVQDNGD